MPQFDTAKAINQIGIEGVTEADGSLGWVWDAYKLDGGRVAGGAASTLPEMLDSMLAYLRDEGFVP